MGTFKNLAKKLAEKAAEKAQNLKLTDNIESFTQLNGTSNETTDVSSVDKSSLHTLVGIIVIANIFTYSSFKFLNSTKKKSNRISYTLCNNIRLYSFIFYSFMLHVKMGGKIG